MKHETESTHANILPCTGQDKNSTLFSSPSQFSSFFTDLLRPFEPFMFSDLVSEREQSLLFQVAAGVAVAVLFCVLIRGRSDLL